MDLAFADPAPAQLASYFIVGCQLPHVSSNLSCSFGQPSRDFSTRGLSVGYPLFPFPPRRDIRANRIHPPIHPSIQPPSRSRPLLPGVSAAMPSVTGISYADIAKRTSKSALGVPPATSCFPDRPSYDP